MDAYYPNLIKRPTVICLAKRRNKERKRTKGATTATKQTKPYCALPQYRYEKTLNSPGFPMWGRQRREEAQVRPLEGYRQ